MDMGSWYAKPLVDFAATHVRLGGYTETGAGAANLIVASSRDWILAVSPGIEFGMQTALADGTALRPYIRAGATFLDTDEVSVETSFAAAPGVPFTVKGRVENVYGDVEAGVHVLTTSGINVRLDYEGRFADNSRQHAGSVKLSAPWCTVRLRRGPSGCDAADAFACPSTPDVGTAARSSPRVTIDRLSVSTSMRRQRR